MGTIIYGLADPRTGQLRYVGKTKGSTHSRRLAHLNDVKRGRVFYIPRHRWISELLAEGLEPEIFEIEVVEDWREAEQFWISYFRSIGCDLLNATAGGDGLCCYRHTEQTRAKQSAAAKARYARPGEREKSGASVNAAYLRPEARQNLRQGRRKVPRASVKIAIDALVAYGRSEQGRAARSLRHKGKTVSPETIAKLSAANKGKKWPAERIARFVQFRTGRKHSAQTIEKMRASAIKARALRRLSSESAINSSAAGSRAARGPSAASRSR